MFKKPFKIKSNCQLKSSEKKKLVSRINNGLQLSHDHELFAIKDSMNVVKVTTYSGANVSIYVHISTPILFELQDVIYPTIFTLWKFPNLLYSFVTHDGVLGKLFNGADLMLPGVIFSLDLPRQTQRIISGMPVGVCTNTNRACVAVGQSIVSGNDIISGNKGRAVKILHTFGDELEKLLDDVPKLPIINQITEPLPNESGNGYFDSASSELTKNFENNCNIAESICVETTPSTPVLEDTRYSDNSHSNVVDLVNSGTQTNGGIDLDNGDEETEMSDEWGTSDQATTDNLVDDSGKQVTTDVNMDELAEYCLLKSLLSKKLDLPILTNLFYKNFMLNVVPSGLELNIKKTKHKKLSNMLKNMVTQEVLAIEDNKGVQSITRINFNNSVFKYLKTKFEFLEGLSTDHPAITSDDPFSNLEKPEDITEDLVINKVVSPLFNNTPYQKGNSLSVSNAREVVVWYIKKNCLPIPSSQIVTLDPVLSDVLSTRQLRLPWSEVVSKVIGKMGRCYKIQTSKGRVISGKGNLPFIEISTATRSGNKCVTLVNNLERFGINIIEFSRHCQHALAASTTTHSGPSGVQFQVQGNHKPYISSLLVDKYNIPQRLILGYAEKSKGKKSHR